MGGCLSSDSGPAVPNIVLNLDATPNSDQDRRIIDSLAKHLEKTDTLLSALQGYKGCEKYIRTALADPTPETETAAWNAVEKSVEQLYEFYKFSDDINSGLKQLLEVLCAPGDLAASLASHSCLVGSLAQILVFCFRFDELKMVNPAIQNDFSYYRRVLSRKKSGTSQIRDENGKKKKKKTQVTEEVANRMSFFFAYPTPMMKALIDTTAPEIGSAQVVPGLAMAANVAAQMLQRAAPGDYSPQAQLLLLCVMTGSIVLIDHLDPQGAFHKGSPIRTRDCIQLMKTNTQHNTDFLLNSIRFTTLHLNDDSTQPVITRLLA